MQCRELEESLGGCSGTTSVKSLLFDSGSLDCGYNRLQSPWVKTIEIGKRLGFHINV